MRPLVKISFEKATELLQKQSLGSYKPVAAKWQGQWYDIRGYSKNDMREFAKQVGAEGAVEVNTQPIIEGKGDALIRNFGLENEAN